jgi:hypothetical protein
MHNAMQVKDMHSSSFGKRLIINIDMGGGYASSISFTHTVL